MNKEIIQRYAQVVAKLGLNIQKGQCLRISAGINNYDFALAIAEEAYKAGAKFVDIEVNSNRLSRFRFENQTVEELAYTPEFAADKLREMAKDKWSICHIDNLDELDELDNVSPEKLQFVRRDRGQKYKFYRDEVSKGNIVWNVIAYPTPKWAMKVMKMDEPDKALKALWEKIITIMRLDASDPVEAWKQHNKRLYELKDKLDNLGIDKLKFQSPGTDLEVGLLAKSRWITGSSFTNDGIEFFANMPTEEVFTTPDRLRTNGKVSVTKPLMVMGTLVEGAVLEFKEGKVVGFDAAKGKENLARFLETDEGSSFAGEIALVDASSPINKADMQFDSILYDENATCHLALGAGYTECVEGMLEVTDPEELMKNGVNFSFNHTDFMIGSENTDVIAFTKDGKEIKIMEKGSFII